MLGGQLGGTGAKAVHWSQVQAKRRVPPKYPQAARELNEADGDAADSFTDFVQRYDHNAWRLVEALLQRQSTAPLR